MGGKIFGSLMFCCLSLFVIWVAWVPPRYELRKEQASVTKVYPHASWVDIELRTDSGVVLKCHGRKSSPFTPCERFQRLYDDHAKIEVSYKGEKPFEVKAGSETVVSYDSYTQRQKMMWFISLFLVVMAFGVFTVKQGGK